MKLKHVLLFVIVMGIVVWLFWPEIAPRLQSRMAETLPQATATPISPLATPPVDQPMNGEPAAAALGTNVPADTAAAPAAEIEAAPANTEGMDLQKALGMLAEIDQSCHVDDDTATYCDARFAVSDLGQQAVAAIVFLSDQQIDDLRVVCDDTCSSFYIINPNGTVKQVNPEKTYPANFDYSNIGAAEQSVASRYGINIEKGEILAQHLFGNFAVSKGDALLVFGADNPELGVNRGTFLAWK